MTAPVAQPVRNSKVSSGGPHTTALWMWSRTPSVCNDATLHSRLGSPVSTTQGRESVLEVAAILNGSESTNRGDEKNRYKGHKTVAPGEMPKAWV